MQLQKEIAVSLIFKTNNFSGFAALIQHSVKGLGGIG